LADRPRAGDACKDAPVTTTKWCPNCGSEYLTGVEQCIDCEVELVDTPPADVDVDVDIDEQDGDVVAEDDEGGSTGGAVGDQVSYELNEWSGESRMLIEQLMAGAGVVRAWEGTTLVVSRADEDRVDELIEHVEASAESALDPDAERVVYEVGDWTADQLNVLTEALASAGIGYEFDIEGDLAVLATDEDRVETLLDGLDFGTPASAESEGEDVDPDDGIETAGILSDLFVACDRLQRDATDHDGVLGAVAAVNRVEGRRLPFGYSPSVWNDLVEQAVRLRSDLEDGEASDPVIEEHALELRTLLRQYV
jgi:hypothetical protein